MLNRALCMPNAVFITGASSGIGRAVALEYAGRGAYVALAARRKDELERVAKEVEERGGRALVLPVDVSDPAAAMEAVRNADRELGALEMVIANAGVGYYGHASTMSWEDVNRQLEINVRGAMATLTAAIPIFLAHKGGHLVGVTSLAGQRGLPKSAPYYAAKAAVSTFLETLRIDLRDAGIRVTDVQPGFVETPRTQRSTHRTPFRWTADRAARHIVRRLDAAPATIAFPWPLVVATRFGRLLPACLYDRIARSASH
jgi:NADP-dependent 3-hydroxy acid dehydrogenase YdfG